VILIPYGQDSLSVNLLEVKYNLPHEWNHPENPEAAEQAKESARKEKKSPHSVMFELGKIKASSSVKASFIEYMLLNDLVESLEQSTFSLKDGLKWSIFPE
jgi:hypothetical protein